MEERFSNYGERRKAWLEVSSWRGGERSRWRGDESKRLWRRGFGTWLLRVVTVKWVWTFESDGTRLRLGRAKFLSLVTTWADAERTHAWFADSQSRRADLTEMGLSHWVSESSRLCFWPTWVILYLHGLKFVGPTYDCLIKKNLKCP